MVTKEIPSKLQQEWESYLADNLVNPSDYEKSVDEDDEEGGEFYPDEDENEGEDTYGGEDYDSSGMNDEDNDE